MSLRNIKLCNSFNTTSCFLQSLPCDLAFTASFDSKRAKTVWIPEEPIKDLLLPVSAGSRQKPVCPLPPVPKQAAPKPVAVSHFASNKCQLTSSHLSIFAKCRCDECAHNGAYA